MSKPIEGCPQPETPIRERAWTAEQVERAADDATPFSPRWAQMLRAYAATLRQQATNQPEIGSKLVGGGAVSDEVVARFVEESAQIISGAPFPSARSLAKAREISDKMLEAVAPLLRAPGGQGGVMLDFPGIGGAGPFPVVDGKVTLPDTTMSDIAHHFRAGHSLAQNAQGEAVPAFWAAVSDDGEIAIAYSADDGNSGAAARTECNQWINDHGGVFHLRPLYLHAERARVPATDADIAAWAERHDLSFGGSKIDARSAFEDAETLHLAADPSLPAEDHRDLQLGEMKRRACIAHTLCYELSLRHPEIPELGDDGKLHCAIHDVLAVDTPSAKVSGPLPGGAAAPSQPEDAASPGGVYTMNGRQDSDGGTCFCTIQPRTPTDEP